MSKHALREDPGAAALGNRQTFRVDHEPPAETTVAKFDEERTSRGTLRGCGSMRVGIRAPQSARNLQDETIG